MKAYTKKDFLIPFGLVFTLPGSSDCRDYKSIRSCYRRRSYSQNERFFAAPTPAIIHIIASLIYGLVGAFQFSQGIRKNHIIWHKLSGRILCHPRFNFGANGIMAHSFLSSCSYRWGLSFFLFEL